MKNIAIVCDVMKGEFERITPDDNHNNLDFIFLEQHLHDTPDKMRKKLQDEIDKIDDIYDKIILGYGLCSNGIVGLKSDKHEIIVPKVDDCISLFLGSKERYVEEFKNNPATYYLCRGWIEYGSDPYRGYIVNAGKEDKIPKEWIRNKERYGRRILDEDTTKFLITQLMGNYNRVVLIDNNDLEEIHRKYANDMAKFLSEVLNKNIELVEIKGSTALLKKISGGNWDKENFIRVQKGERISQESFM